MPCYSSKTCFAILETENFSVSKTTTKQAQISLSKSQSPISSLNLSESTFPRYYCCCFSLLSCLFSIFIITTREDHIFLEDEDYSSSLHFKFFRYVFYNLA
jgi:hypothetical protein